MSTGNGRVIQYGRRFSNKQKRASQDIEERTPKRQRLLEDEDEEENPFAISRETSTLAASLARSPFKKLATMPPLPIQKHRSTPPAKDDGLATGTESIVRARPNSPVALASTSTKESEQSSQRPKDLAGIFAPLPDLSPQLALTPKKSLTKRMLVRSRTEPSLGAKSPQASTSSLSATLSSPGLMASPTKSDVPRRETPPSSPSGASTVHRRTYSQSRSFLVALPASMALQGCPDSLNPVKGEGRAEEDVRESYTDLRSRWGVDESEDDPTYATGIANDLLSITELRSKGESRRFLDEVGYLFEGLEGPEMSINVRRSSAAEIVLKMCGIEFAKKAKAADFIGQAWEALRNSGAGDGDKILDIYLLFFVALVARDKRDLDDLSRKADFYDVIIRLLRSRREEDGLGIFEGFPNTIVKYSKAEKAALGRIRDAFLNQSDSVIQPFIPSMHSLASHSLCHLSVSDHPPQVLPAVVDTILEASKQLSTWMLPDSVKPTSESPPSINSLLNCLDYLDAQLLQSSDGSPISVVMDAPRDALCLSLASVCALPQFISNSTWHASAVRAMETAIRVLISLSHLDPDWCSSISRDSKLLSVLVCEVSSVNIYPVKTEPEDRDDSKNGSHSLDRQSLSLALLSNLVLTVDESKNRLREISLELRCSTHADTELCNCSLRPNAIECLSRLFVRLSVKIEAPNSEDLDFFRSHLSALLCLLAIRNQTNEGIIRIGLAEGGDVSEKGFVHSVQTFLDFYGAVKDGRGRDTKDEMQSQIAAACNILCPKYRLRLRVP